MLNFKVEIPNILWKRPNYQFWLAEVLYKTPCLHRAQLILKESYYSNSNILLKHDTVEELDRRIKSLEEMMLTDKLRIELLENWIQNQAEEIKKIGEKSTEDSLENLIGKIDAVETDLKSYREQINVES